MGCSGWDFIRNAQVLPLSKLEQCFKLVLLHQYFQLCQHLDIVRSTRLRHSAWHHQVYLNGSQKRIPCQRIQVLHLAGSAVNRDNRQEPVAGDAQLPVWINGPVHWRSGIKAKSPLRHQRLVLLRNLRVSELYRSIQKQKDNSAAVPYADERRTIEAGEKRVCRGLLGAAAWGPGRPASIFRPIKFQLWGWPWLQLQILI